MKFKSDIEIQAGVEAGGSTGSNGQVLSSTGSSVAWIDQNAINAGNAEHVVVYAKNTHTASIAKGTPVYITGTVGATDTVQIAPADASDSAKMPAVGLLDETLAVNAFGYVITGGFMDNITTDPIDGATPSSNDTVYVKAGGGLTLTKPTGSTGLIQNVAKVGKVSGGNSGSLIVSSILRTNDVPNLTTGKIWVGDGNTVESTIVHLDEPNGRMGIGTTSPSDKLQVNQGSDSFRGITIEGTSPALYLKDTQATNAYHIGANGNYLYFLEDSNQSGTYNNIMAYWDPSNNFIFKTGNVGIGTTSPISKLDIRGVLSFPYISTVTGTTVVKFSEATDDEFVLKANLTGFGATGNSMSFGSGVSGWASDIMTWRGDGNVGIGTTSPDAKLHVEGNVLIDAYNQGEDNGLFFREGFLTIDQPSITVWDMTNGGSSPDGLSINANDGIRFRENGGEVARFKDGNFGIGTTSPSYKLDVSGDARFTGDVNVGAATTNGAGIHLIYSTSTPEIRIQAGEGGDNAFSIYNTATDPDAVQFFINNNLGYSHLGNARGDLKLETSSGVNLTLSGSNATFAGDLTVSGGDITLGGTGRIQGVDTVSANTDAANKLYVDNAVAGVPQGDITAVTAGTFLTGGGTSGSVTLNADASKLAHIVDSANASVNAGWITVAEADTARRAGEIYVTDGESGDHSYIRIEWMRSYADNNFTVLNCGGHQNRIQGVRVLQETADPTYGPKYLQVKVTVTSNYYVIITAPGTIPNYGDFTAVTPVLEDTKTGYSVTGAQLENLQDSSVGTQEGITVGEELYVNGAGNSYFLGNVGIGTTSPAYKLDVNGDIRVDSTSVAQMFLDSAASNDAVLNFHENASQKGKIGYDTSLGGIALVAGSGSFSTADMVLLDGGNVGIGTTSPTAGIHVNTSQQAARFVSSQATGLEVQGGGNSQPIAIFKDTAASEKVRISSTGNVGIGTTSPGAKVDIIHSGLSTMFRLSNTEANATTKYSAIVGRHYTNTEENVTGMLITSSSSSTGGTVSIGGGISTANAVNNVLFYTAANNTTLTGTERMRITSSGNVGIGDIPSFKLDVNVTSSRARFKAASGDANIELSSIAGHDWLIQSKSDSSLAIYDEDEASERMRITSAGDVGIGTTSPSAKLHVAGEIRAYDSGNTYYANMTANSSWGYFNTNAARIFLNKEVQVDTGLIGSYNEALQLRTGGTTRMYINSSTGDVGIGTTSPQSPLHIYKSLSGGVGGELRLDNNNSAVANKTQILFSDGAGASNSYDRAAITCETEASPYMGQLQFKTGVGAISTKLIILGNGNVGIGTTSPTTSYSKVLQINASGNGSTLRLTDAGSGSAVGSGLELLQYGVDSYIINRENGPMNFWTSNSQKMVILANGNVGIGTTSPGYKLDVTGTIYGNGGIIGSSDLLLKDTASAYSTELKMQNNTHTLGIDYENNETLRFITRSGTTTVPITFAMRTGNITCVSLTQTSDERKKTKIKDLSGDNIDVRWRSFEMKANEGEYRTGVIAQELEQNHPEFVNTDGEGLKSVKYIDLLIAKIAELETRIKQLENN